MTEGLKHICGKRRTIELAVVLAACFLVGFSIAEGSFSKNTADLSYPTQPVSLTEQDFSHFTHTNPQHARMPCMLCHRRDDNSATPRRSVGHSPCSGCHEKQFADSGSTICTVCHTAPGSSALKAFPPLRSFGASFNHARHLQLTSCATCHRPARGGVSLSIPAGTSGHRTCFQCHTPDKKVGERDIGACNVCHQLERPPRTTDWAKAFNVNFNHSEHTRRMNCDACHMVLASGLRGRQVTAPIAAMHFPPSRARSCATCHNNARAFGPPDFADCKRCHEGRTFRF
jgi:c(7)-type cytochrome triheme protein